MYANIIKTCAAHGAMPSGAVGAAHIGCMPMKYCVTFGVINYFIKRHCLTRVHFVFLGKFCIMKTIFLLYSIFFNEPVCSRQK